MEGSEGRDAPIELGFGCGPVPQNMSRHCRWEASPFRAEEKLGEFGPRALPAAKVG